MPQNQRGLQPLRMLFKRFTQEQAFFRSLFSPCEPFSGQLPLSAHANPPRLNKLDIHLSESTRSSGLFLKKGHLSLLPKSLRVFRKRSGRALRRSNRFRVGGKARTHRRASDSVAPQVLAYNFRPLAHNVFIASFATDAPLVERSAQCPKSGEKTPYAFGKRR